MIHLLDKNRLADLKEYVEYHLKKDDKVAAEQIYESMESHELTDYVSNNQKPTFQELLFHFIDQKKTTDTIIYKRAGIDRRHFSKIRSNPNYQIGKNTAIALCLALELTLTEANELLHAAGFTLSNSHTGDLVIQYCLENKIYNLQEVNEALDDLNAKPLINGS